MSQTTISGALFRALREHGVREIFGIPGDFALPLFRALEGDDAALPLFTLSHEPAVGFAADAAARVRGGLGAAFVTYGAGALNMVNAVASAYAEKSPVVVVSGAPGVREAQGGLLLHHQAKTLDSQARIYQEITCAQCRLDDPVTAPSELARVLRACRRLSRPVYIEVPRDRVETPCDWAPVLPVETVDSEAVEACVAEVLQRMRTASAPIMMVGVEVRRFGLEAEVAELATRLGIPVVTSLLGRGLLAEAEAPLLGAYLGAAGVPEVSDRVEASDALLLLGVIVSDTNFGVSSKQIDLRRSIQAIDGQVTLGFHTYPDLPLEALVKGLLKKLDQAPLRPAISGTKATYPHGLVADAAPIEPIDIAAAVNDLMRARGRFPLAADMGDCMFTAMDIENTILVAPGYYATMGFGVPAGFGVQVATGARPIVMVGDGAFQMTGWELGNCRRYGWDPIVIVFNNLGWEMMRAFQPGSDFNDLGDWRFADMAAGLGGRGVRVSTRQELKAALEEAADTRGQFQLIEVMLAPGALSTTLARFVDRMRRHSAMPA
ncbi:MAG: indolepyruvate/phenylpyruvate decarboxylase [Deltaproteobacteria bacterium]|nr:indolepyruvate/phenylpyruvate decarboxylase [Deltaproteobacteria bacterium]